jgi:hypothetical protein
MPKDTNSTLYKVLTGSVIGLSKAVKGVTEVLITIENNGVSNDELSRIHGDLLKVENKLHSWMLKHQSQETAYKQFYRGRER